MFKNQNRMGRVFNNEGQLTDEALQICRKLAVDPQSLYPLKQADGFNQEENESKAQALQKQ